MFFKMLNEWDKRLFGLYLGRVKQLMTETQSTQYTWQWAACAYTIMSVKSSQLLKTGVFPFKVIPFNLYEIFYW